ncbi:MAG: hypothetical protein SLAVMIC_00698 [uncultured marine phage]|uniref:Uncharacterized protein n=1 Tax=uncultured marine phage TaxID=707152 RepID=A0A8D9C9C7_9VIRU|nr:MAG: hypothetical protein SLAVMIC_00698 [uncultured marine phage]
MKRYKKIISDRGDEFYVRFDVGSGYSSGSIYCYLYKKYKIPFLYKKLEWLSMSSLSTTNVNGKILPVVTSCHNVSEISIESKKEITRRVVEKHYAYITEIEKNKKDSEEWDGLLGDSIKREKRLEKLLDKDE